MNIKKFSCWFNKDGAPGRPTMEHAIQSLFCELQLALQEPSFPITISLTEEQDRLDYRIVAEIKDGQ